MGIQRCRWRITLLKLLPVLLAVTVIGMTIPTVSGDWEQCPWSFSRAIPAETVRNLPLSDRIILMLNWIDIKLAIYLGDLGNYEAAINIYNRVEVRIPPNRQDEFNAALLYYDRASTYQAWNKSELAIDDFGRAIQLEQNCAPIYYNRGLAYYQIGNYLQAIKDYSDAITLSPDYGDAYINRGSAYYMVGENEQALLDINQGIALNEEQGIAHDIAYYSRAVVHMVMGSNQKALSDFTRAIKLMPDYANAYWGRGSCYWALGDQKAALSDFREYAQLAGDQADPSVLATIAQLETQLALTPTSIQ